MFKAIFYIVIGILISSMFNGLLRNQSVINFAQSIKFPLPVVKTEAPVSEQVINQHVNSIKINNNSTGNNNEKN